MRARFSGGLRAFEILLRSSRALQIHVGYTGCLSKISVLEPLLAIRRCLVALSVLLALTICAHAESLAEFSDSFWQWRAQEQPFSNDDIPRIDRPAGFDAKAYLQRSMPFVEAGFSIEVWLELPVDKARPRFALRQRPTARRTAPRHAQRSDGERSCRR